MASFEPTEIDSENDFENIFGDESGDDEDFMGFTAEDVAAIQRAYEEDNIEDFLKEKMIRQILILRKFRGVMMMRAK